MNKTFVDELVRIGHGAIQVEEATECPTLVFLAGPISYWWGNDGKNFGTPIHAEYVEFRDAVEAACVMAGYAVYKPFAALRGSWHEDFQRINTLALMHSAILLDLNLHGVSAPGTDREIKMANVVGIPILHAGRFYGPTRIDALIEDIRTCVEADKAGTLEAYND